MLLHLLPTSWVRVTELTEARGKRRWHFCWLSRLILEAGFSHHVMGHGYPRPLSSLVDHSERSRWAVGKPLGRRRNPTGCISSLSRGALRKDGGCQRTESSLTHSNGTQHSSPVHPGCRGWKCITLGPRRCTQTTGEILATSCFH